MTTLPPVMAAAATSASSTASRADFKAPRSEAELIATARSFEAAFLTPLVTEMLRTAGPASLGAGNAEEMWRSFQAGAIAEEIARTETTGIAQSLRSQLKAYGG